MNKNRVTPCANNAGLLDPIQLDQLEKCFRAWSAQPARHFGRASRIRILLIFLLIRYTGAKLREALALNPADDIRADRRIVSFHGLGNASQMREVQVSQTFMGELTELLPLVKDGTGKYFSIDPAYVRRQFYERAAECGFDKKQGGPEMIRKARAVELLRNNMPLPAVQRLLGHSSPELTTSYVTFSEEDMQEITRLYMERESGQRTSARNRFFGKVSGLTEGVVQTLVELTTPDGGAIRALITNTSRSRLGLEPGRLVTAEIKSPWLTLERCDRAGDSSAENRREGVIHRITSDSMTTECSVTLPDGTELCSILTTRGFTRLKLSVGDSVRVLFGAYAVILHAD